MSPLGDHMTGKYGKEDQPSGEETTWTNTGAILLLLLLHVTQTNLTVCHYP